MCIMQGETEHRSYETVVAVLQVGGPEKVEDRVLKSAWTAGCIVSNEVVGLWEGQH
jgi:hypothetical protein